MANPVVIFGDALIIPLETLQERIDDLTANAIYYADQEKAAMGGARGESMGYYFKRQIVLARINELEELRLSDRAEGK